MSHPQFELYKGKDAQFYFRLTASNGQNILASEGYKSKDSCQNGIESVLKNAGNAAMYETREANNGKYYFVLKAGNNQVIGTSQMYASAASCADGVESVMRNAPLAGIDDQT